MKKSITYAAILGALVMPELAHAENVTSVDDINNLSLESLGNIVTSVSRKPEDSFRAAAAIYVITNDDIKISGATHIAEVLRGVPGLDVAQVDASDWAISSRGFNGVFANKLLVQVDGRTIYTPLDAGVYWDVQNIPLEDVERIEVIRGPGATQWGSNAVNGIINIITKSATATQGIYASTLAGNQDHSITDVRYGGKIGKDIYYRTYAEFSDRASTPVSADGSSGYNSWQTGKAGFRSDWNGRSDRKITIQGDIYKSYESFYPSYPVFSASGVDSFKDKYNSNGFNLLGRLSEKHSDSLQSTFQSYVDFQHIDYYALSQDVYTYDFDYQTSWKADERNNVMWGAGIRYIDISMVGSSQTRIARDVDNEIIINTFIQDTYALMPDAMYLTLGSKFEHNTFTGLEIEPSVRVSWYPDNKQTVWAAVSRAVRTPAVAEESWVLNKESIAPDSIAQLQYNEKLSSEDLVAYEIGHRIKPTKKITLDSTAFLNVYGKLNTYEPLAEIDAGGGNSYSPYQIATLGSGRAYGFEESISWDVLPTWNLKANYSYINLLLEQGRSQDTTFKGQSGDSPHHKFMLRSQIYLPYDVQLINSGYYTGRLPNQGISAYLRFDTHLIWSVTNNIELSLVGQNLLDNKHPEFGGSANAAQNDIPRSVYGKITLRY